jgi:BirA family biotin operon repressor/biotin-[acetyl-CoA-carboxylase] ligase
VALAETVVRLGAVEAWLKWPNDLLIDDRKCGGILSETVPSAEPGEPAVVVGIGLNVSLRVDELPDPRATSLQLAGAECVDRDPLLRSLLRGFAGWYDRWRSAAGDPQACGLRVEYLSACATIGRQIQVSLPNKEVLTGEATTVDNDGRLVVQTGDGQVRAVAAGDVGHVRGAG